MRTKMAVAWLLLCALAAGARADRTPHHNDRTVAKDIFRFASDTKIVQARQQVQAIYDRQTAALLRKDVKGFLALCTPDYQDTKPDGSVYPAARIRQVLPGQLAAYSKQFVMKAAIKTFRLSGRQANVVVNRHVELMRTDAQHRRQYPWKSDTISQDVWIKTAQGWRLQRSRETRFQHKSAPLLRPSVRRNAHEKS